MKKQLLYGIGLLLAGCLGMMQAAGRQAPAADLRIEGLRCEYATDPIGLDVRSPQFSWRTESQRRGVLQSAYQIVVARSQEELAQDNGVWNSGRIESSRSAGIRYEGPALSSKERYYWKVRVWTTDGGQSDWSAAGSFEMGLLDEKDWVSDWIAYVPGKPGRIIYFKGTFCQQKEVEKARLYISGLGYYEMYINNRKVGDHVLDPAQSSYDKRVYYASYDVKDYLSQENAKIQTEA